MHWSWPKFSRISKDLKRNSLKFTYALDIFVFDEIRKQDETDATNQKNDN